MDDRTPEQKLRDTVLHSEHRTVGHRMSRKVLVIAPDHRRAQEWAHEHGIAYSDVVYVGPHNWANILNGMRGVEHVVLGWAYFDSTARVAIKEMLAGIESPPFEGAPDAELHGADPVRD